MSRNKEPRHPLRSKKRMREQIQRQLKTEFEKSLFFAAFRNLNDSSNPLRFNNFAYACRELVRHILARLAPDDKVRSCTWYRNETERENGISRKQRVYYAVQGGLADTYVKKCLGLDVEAIHRALRNATDRLSKYTHIEVDTFAITDCRVAGYVHDTLCSVCGLFDAIEGCRKMLIDALWEHIDLSVINTSLRDTICAIDELATHHFIDEVHTDNITIARIDSDNIWFLAEGSITCELQWGSNSDLERGDGVVFPQSFPFKCELWSPVHEPQNVQSDTRSLTVDTSSWRD